MRIAIASDHAAVDLKSELRDYLTDQGASSRRGASLAFLFPIPEQPAIGIGQTILDGTVGKRSLGSRWK